MPFLLRGLLQTLGVSVLVTTFQAGKLVMLRVLSAMSHPDVINDQPRVLAHSFVVSDETLHLVPGPLSQTA